MAFQPSYQGFARLGLLKHVSLLFALFFAALFANVASAATVNFKTTGLPKSGGLLDKRQSSGDAYLLGVGKADITGPIVEIGFAGYADLDQKGTGLRQRLYSRAFIIGDVDNPEDRIIYLVADFTAGDTAVRRGILEGIAALGSEYAVYTKDRVAVTGTHSHAGTGGYYNYLLPQITNLGFDRQSYQAVVDGALLSIKRAHESLTEGHLDVGTTEVPDAAVNRSPSAYLNNPSSERDRYDSDVDTTMTLLRLRRASDSKLMGIVNWFAVHPTSIYQNSTHVAGDNKGVAAWLLEKEYEGSDAAVEDGFVAAFAQANHGDTTPNVLGAWCEDGSGQQCDFETSTCADGKSQSCRGRGPEFAKLDLGVSSCFEIGRRQYAGAKEIMDSMDSSSTAISGSTVKGFHTFQNMSSSTFTLPSGEQVKTCSAALGHSFAAGTTDGPGAIDFTQGDAGFPNNPLWSIVGGLLSAPSSEQRQCHRPKPILLDVGAVSQPYPWTPNIVDIQTMRIGQLVIIVASSEATTMAGRRWRNAVAEAASDVLDDGEEPIVLLGGVANSYTHYVTTPEEYDTQRYEGASTLYGRNTLDAYINVTLSNLHYLSSSSSGSPPAGPSPPDNRGNSLNLNTGVVQDATPSGRSFGSVITQPSASYSKGDAITVRFQGANPRNNLRLEGTYASVEKRNGNNWETVRDDSDWFLVLTWERTNWFLGHSEVTIRWESEEYGDGPGTGTYRIRYRGHSRNLLGRISEFTGVSNSFELA